ncbi:MAG: flagellar hook-associated protein FlgK [Actinomycetaceae bacterium]|nr:flagellar hook-associated protein FlgK [Actinomycetaceae bacterium]
MASTFGSLNAALSGLYASQRLIEVSGHNIENMNTPGYTKQRVDQKALGISSIPSIFAGSTITGGGVELERLRRMGDVFLDNKLRLETGNSAGAGEVAKAWKNMESVMKELSDTGMNRTLSQFYTSWGDIANSSESMAARSVTLQRAQAAVDQIASGYENINTLWKDARSQVDAQVSDLNATMDSVAKLNERIRREKNAGADVNELIDERAKLVLQLSKYTGANAKERDDGTIDVYVAGNAMVAGDYANHVIVNGARDMPGIEIAPKNLWAAAEGAAKTTAPDKDTVSVVFEGPGKGKVVIKDKDGADVTASRLAGVKTPDGNDVLRPSKLDPSKLEASFSMEDYQHDEGPVRLVWSGGGHTAVITEGTLGGKIANVAPSGKPEVNGNIGSGGAFAEVGKLYNDLATNLAKEINALHKAEGTNQTRTLNKDAGGNYTAGGDFFDFNIDVKLPPAQRLKVAISDPRNIAAAKEGMGAFDGSVADTIMKKMNEQRGAVDTWATSVVDIGVHAKSASGASDLAEQGRRIAERAHMSGTSVEMNEEIVGLIKGQHAYSAAARVMNTVNTMLEELINLGRR